MLRNFIAVIVGLAMAAPGLALAQTAGGAGSGLNSNAGTMSSPNLNVDNGINANGTPKQQSPGASMTNGPNSAGAAGGVTGGAASASGGGAATQVPTAGATATGQ